MEIRRRVIALYGDWSKAHMAGSDSALECVHMQLLHWGGAMSGKRNGRYEQAFKVTVDFPDPLPVTSQELALVETYMRDLVIEILEQPGAKKTSENSM
jgi:hypothetical protein